MAASTRARRRRFALHARPAQVDVAVAQAHRLVGRRPGRRRGTAAARPGPGSPPRSRRARPRRWRARCSRLPSGRRRTVPSTCTTHSLRTSTDPSTTHWTTPLWSRRSTNARCSPCSRRRATQPHSRTRSPACAEPQLAAQMRSASPSALTSALLRSGSPPARPVAPRAATAPRRPPGRPRRHAGAQRHRPGGELLGPDDHGARGAPERSASFSWALSERPS